MSAFQLLHRQEFLQLEMHLGKDTWLYCVKNLVYYKILYERDADREGREFTEFYVGHLLMYTLMTIFQL